MQAIILAAGMGRRLGDLTKNNTKCMVKVNGTYLIDRLMRQLSGLSLERIVIVIGYQGDKLRNHLGESYCGIPIDYVVNSVYNKTNNIYSLYLAKELLQEDDTLLIESDLIFDDALFRKILDNPYPNLALVAKYEPWMDGTMVQLNEDGDIIDFITRKSFRYDEVDSYYKTVNIYKLSRKFLCNSYVPFLEAYSKAMGNNEYYEQVLRVITLLDNCELKGLPLNGEKWYEIDDVQDLDIAETIFAEENRLNLFQKRYGGYWRFPNLLDFCYLVNPYFPPQRMIDEIKANFEPLLRQYPSGMSINTLIAAKNFGIRHDYVAVGNGAAEIIKSLMGFMEGKLGVVYPTFEEYPHRKPDDVIGYYPSNPDFAYSAEDLMVFFKDKGISALLLVNPDNPSGNFVPFSELIRLVEWGKKQGIHIIVDESFVDFSSEGIANTLLRNDILDDNPHLLVVKSISKSFGVPGLRLGIIASSDIALVGKIRKDLAIWNINSFAEFYMQIFSKYERYYVDACKKFAVERDRFQKELQKIPYLRVIPSQANYFLCEVLPPYDSCKLTEELLDRNALIKDCSGKTGFDGKNYVRIAVRDAKDNDALVCLLHKLAER